MQTKNNKQIKNNTAYNTEKNIYALNFDLNIAALKQHFSDNNPKKSILLN